MPREGHDSTPSTSRRSCRHFNPRAPRGARRPVCGVYRRCNAISIHVPREGHDTNRPRFYYLILISIHVPREGHDKEADGTVITAAQFQSTCPARGTTILTRRQAVEANPRFQSTCPARGTTDTYHDNYLRFGISIHVPREGHDYKQTALLLPDINFNPRAPRGARQDILTARARAMGFQSTCPARGTTQTDRAFIT